MQRPKITIVAAHKIPMTIPTIFPGLSPNNKQNHDKNFNVQMGTGILIVPALSVHRFS